MRRSRLGLVVLSAALIAACQNTSAGGGAGGAGGRGGRGGRGGGRGAAVAVHTAKLQRIAVQREVDLQGTLLSPDMAKVRFWWAQSLEQQAVVGMLISDLQ